MGKPEPGLHVTMEKLYVKLKGRSWYKATAVLVL